MTYNLFISHSWKYSDQYNRLVNLLDEDQNFDYKNYSVPRDDPIDDAETQKQLKEEIKEQMNPASCVLILAGVYATYSKWINIEIEMAKSMGKKIIAVRPWGADHVSDAATSAADKVVYWNSSSIISAIKEK